VTRSRRALISSICEAGLVDEMFAQKLGQPFGEFGYVAAEAFVMAAQISECRRAVTVGWCGCQTTGVKSPRIRSYVVARAGVGWLAGCEVPVRAYSAGDM
jgi:hypothetical protein